MPLDQQAGDVKCGLGRVFSLSRLVRASSNRGVRDRRETRTEGSKERTRTLKTWPNSKIWGRPSEIVREYYHSEQLLKVYLAPGKVVAFERGAVRANLNVRQKPANRSPLLHHQSHQWNKFLQVTVRVRTSHTEGKVMKTDRKWRPPFKLCKMG